MATYNQKYKNDVIVTIIENSGDSYDSSVSDNKYFSAVGQKTSGNLDSISQVTRINLWAVKQDTVLNLEDGNVKVYDDDGSLGSLNLSGLSNKQWSSLVINLPRSLHFNTRDNNIRFDDFNTLDGMTQDIGDLMDSENVNYFNLTVTTPSDVKCNYTTGRHSFIKGQSVNVTFDGNIRKGDKITIKRNARNDAISNIQFDTDFVFSNLGFDGITNAEFIYTHGEAPKPVEKTTVEFTSSDDGIQWQNATMVDSGSNFTNPVIIQKGYELRQPLAVEFTDKNDKTTTLTYGSGSTVYFDGDTPNKTTWNLTVNTGYKKLNIKAGQTKYKTYELEPTLQNAKIIEPQAIEDDYGKTRYYLDPKHTTITLQANDGYTFESDGSLTYQRDELDQETLTIKATHTNTATITLPSDIDWSNQQYFMLTMGAVKSEIVETTGGFTNIYKADYTNLLKFSNEVIVKITGGTGGGVQSYDVTPYINNLIMLPFNVPTGEKSTIVAGNETFTTQLPTVDNSYLTVDLGKIKVDEQYKNGFDYYQVKTRLMLPYTNMIELDPKHVINQTVSIKYIVNVVNGDTTINLSNNDDLFYSNQVNLASEIPFISSATKGSQYTVINQLKTVFRNSIKQAYIIIEQPTPVLNSDFYPTNEKGTLKGYTGNVKASLLNNMDINSNELNALQNLLETGVKIK